MGWLNGPCNYYGGTVYPECALDEAKIVFRCPTPTTAPVVDTHSAVHHNAFTYMQRTVRTHLL